MKKLILHGEAMVFESSLPKNAKKINVVGHKIVADSKTAGNHHVVDAGAGVAFYEDDIGTLFMKNEKPTQVRCVRPDRHDSITLEPNTWEFGVQKEYDYFTESLRNVSD